MFQSSSGGDEDVSDPFFEQQVSKLIALRQVRIARGASYVMWVLCSLNCLDIVPNILARDFPYLSFAIARAVLCMLYGLGAMLPDEWLNARTLPVLHVSCMVALAFCATCEMPPEFRRNRHEPYLVASLILSSMCLRVNLLLVTNVVFEVVFASVIINAATPSEQRTIFVDEGIQLAWVLLMKAFALGGAVFIVDSSARAEVEATLGKCQQTAVESLLGMMCDAVVDLDRNLLHKRHCPKLTGILMLGANRSLQGEPLSACIPEGPDRETFNTLVQQVHMDEQGMPTPSMVSLRLRDSLNNLVKVVLYHVPYIAIGDHTEHLIGLREDTDAEGLGRRVPEAPTAAQTGFGSPSKILAQGVSLDAALLPLSRTQSRRSGSSDGGGSSRSSSRSRSSRASDPENLPDERMSLEVFLEEGLAIRWIADGLREDMGLEIGGSFASVLQDEGRRFSEWVREIFDQKLLAGSSGNFKRTFGDLELVRTSAVGSKDVVLRKAWVFFPAPLLPEDGSSYVISIAMSRGRRKRPTTCSGTAATSVWQDFANAPVRCASPPATRDALGSPAFKESAFIGGTPSAEERPQIAQEEERAQTTHETDAGDIIGRTRGTLPPSTQAAVTTADEDDRAAVHVSET